MYELKTEIRVKEGVRKTQVRRKGQARVKVIQKVNEIIFQVAVLAQWSLVSSSNAFLQWPEA